MVGLGRNGAQQGNIGGVNLGLVVFVIVNVVIVIIVVFDNAAVGTDVCGLVNCVFLFKH